MKQQAYCTEDRVQIYEEVEQQEVQSVAYPHEGGTDEIELVTTKKVVELIED